MPRLERERAARSQRGADDRERGPQFLVGDEALKRMADDRDELELSPPPDIRRGAGHWAWP
jgi:hypothetical protein